MTQPYDSQGKRLGLTQAAKELFYHQGYHRTTLDHVAKRSGVPLGNVHYYFPTKEALALAVLASHETSLRAAFAHWDRDLAHPRDRLTALIRSPLDEKDEVVRYGCPHGSLCQELEKLEESALAPAGGRLLGAWIEWAQVQWRTLGLPEAQAVGLATQLVGAIQGAMLLAHSLRSVDLLVEQLSRIELWLDQELRHPPEKEGSF